MKHFKVFLIVIICLFSLGLMFFPATGSAAETTSDDVSLIAEDGKEPYLAAIAIDYLKESGMADNTGQTVIYLEDVLKPGSTIAAELKKKNAPVLGEPFQVYTISTNNILAHSSTDDISTIIVPTTQWFVPVFIKNKPAAMLTVDYINDKWQVVGIGMSSLEKEMNSISANFKPGKGKNHKFVRIYPALTDLIAADKQGTNKLQLFSYSIIKVDSSLADADGHYKSSDVMPKLKEQVKSNTIQ